MRSSVTIAAALSVSLAAPVIADPFLAVNVGPNSDPATQSCSPPQGGVSGTTTVSFTTTCSRADVGTATGSATAAAGHTIASSQSDSHNGNSLIAGIGAQGHYEDFLTFTSTDSTATSTSVSANLALSGLLEVSGNVAGSSILASANIFGTSFELRALDSLSQGFTSTNAFIVDSGTIAPSMALTLHTPSVTVPLNSPVHFVLDLLVGTFASGPATHALSDFLTDSFKLSSAIAAFNLSQGITVNAGNYLVDNRYIDPLAPSAPVPLPLSGLLLPSGLAFTARRLRLSSVRDPVPA